jgi:5-methylcytosine-specific restriction endonuclease McrA
MYEFDDGVLRQTTERGQIDIHLNKAYNTYKESVPAMRKIATPSTGHYCFEFTDVDMQEAVERLDEAGHRITMTDETAEKNTDRWNIPTDEERYPDNWDEIRKRVYERDSYTCQQCGATNTELHAHHKQPIADGGEHEIDNLQTVCCDCHEELHGFTIE